MQEKVIKQYQQTKYMRNLVFEKSAFEDLEYWVSTDKNKALKIIKLINEIQRDPFSKSSKAEKLKYELSGCSSKRINDEHRIVYEITDNEIKILSCRYHYSH